MQKSIDRIVDDRRVSSDAPGTGSADHHCRFDGYRGEHRRLSHAGTQDQRLSQATNNLVSHAPIIHHIRIPNLFHSALHFFFASPPRYKDGDEIKAGGRLRFLFEDQQSSALIIRNAEIDDTGTYTVLARNNLGEVTTSGELLVRGLHTPCASPILSLNVVEFDLSSYSLLNSAAIFQEKDARHVSHD